MIRYSTAADSAARFCALRASRLARRARQLGHDDLAERRLGLRRKLAAEALFVRRRRAA